MHTVVSFDFAVAIVPGWHSTIFPPYFVAGAIFSGFAMVLMLAIPLRAFYGLQDFITHSHLENMAKIMLATGLIVAYGYVMEAFMAWYSGNIYEKYVQLNRMFGPYAVYYWTLIPCNVAMPQAAVVQAHLRQPALTVRRCPGRPLRHVAGAVRDRRHQPAPRLPAVVVGHVLADRLGLEHVPRHHRVLLCLLFLFIRFLPMISIAEMQTLLPESRVRHDDLAAAAQETN